MLQCAILKEDGVTTGEQLYSYNSYTAQDNGEYHVSLIKHGYLDDYERVLFELNIRMAEHHPLFGIKSYIIPDQFTHTFKIGRKFSYETTKLINWMRFIHYDGEEAELHVREQQSKLSGKPFNPFNFQFTTLKLEEKLWNQVILTTSDYFADDK